MKAQEQIKNDGINFQAETQTDLLVSDEQAEQTKGGVGRVGAGDDVIGGWGQDWIVGGTGQD